MTGAVDSFAWACCGRWAEDRARFALYWSDAAGAEAAWTFWDIQREANRFSNVLAALGVMRGERVALLLGQRAETAALLVACWQMGAVAMPLPAQADGPAAARALQAGRARVAVADGNGQVLLEAARAQGAMPRHAIGVAGAAGEGLRDWAAVRGLASARYAAAQELGNAPALLLDAGTPAAAEASHAELFRQCEAFLAAHPGYPQAGDLFWSPAAWSARPGLLEGLLPAWRLGQPVVAYDGDVSAEAAFALIDKYDVRNARLTPQELEAMMSAMPRPNESLDCRLRTLSTGGAAAAPALAEWLQAQLGVAATA